LRTLRTPKVSERPEATRKSKALRAIPLINWLKRTSKDIPNTQRKSEEWKIGILE
jgi:hypothetical protein